MESILQDIRFAWRSLRRTPGFTAVAALTLALGIGANAAIFSVIQSVLLTPLPYAEPSRVVLVWNRWVGWDKTWISVPEYLDYRRECTSFSEVGAWRTTYVNLTGEQEPERVAAASLTAGTLTVLGIEPILGRVFTEEEDFPGRDAVALLGYGLWQRRFGADPAIVGATIEVEGRPRTVLGVMPPGFELPLDFTAESPTELWLPLAIDTTKVDPQERGSHFLYTVARLAPGVDPAAATSELDALTRRWTGDGLYPETMRFGAFSLPVSEEVVGGIRPALILLLAAVGFLLLIACANVAHLMLTRSETHQREIALRAALGANRRRVLQPLLVESVLLGLTGGGLGLLLAAFAIRLLRGWGAASVPRLSEVTLDLRVLLFTLGLSFMTGIAFGLAPGLRALRLDVVHSLKEGSQGAGGCRRHRLFRSLMACTEQSLAVALVIGAGLMLQSLWKLVNIDPGFRPDNVLTLRVSLPEASYPEPGDVVRFYEQLLEKIRTLPGVQHAGAARALPLTGTIGDWDVEIEGQPEAPGLHPKGDWQVATDGYFETMGMRRVRGRFFDRRDRADGAQVAVINQTMARRYWPDQDPLGARIRLSADEPAPWVSIVGVVGDVVHNGIDLPVKEKFYRPHSQFPLSAGWAPRSMTLVVETAGDPLALAGPARRQMQALDPKLAVADVRTMEEILAASTSDRRFTSLLLGLFAAVALVLAAVGIYGVISYSVARRTHEIGIRMALGAGRLEVLKMILKQGTRVSLAGTGLGLMVALGLTRGMESVLYGVEAVDVPTFALVAVALFCVAVAATYLPARRATRIEPAVALREE